MTSNINSSNINQTYPIAGQDNDSQGFRDNFTNIATNFIAAYNEITELQSKVLVTSPLSGSTSNVTTFTSSVQLVGAQTSRFTESVNTAVTFTGSTATLDYTTGDLQVVALTGPTSLVFANWPRAITAGPQYARMRVLFTGATPATTITFPPSDNPANPLSLSFVGLAKVAGAAYVSPTYVITPHISGNYFLEFSTYDYDAGTGKIMVVPLITP